MANPDRFEIRSTETEPPDFMESEEAARYKHRLVGEFVARKPRPLLEDPQPSTNLSNLLHEKLRGRFCPK